MSVVQLDREASSLALLGSLVREAWPKVMTLPQAQVDAIPAPVMAIISTMWGSGTRELLPHEAAIDEARSRAEWAEALQKSQAKVLDRLAEAADSLYAERGDKPVFRRNRFGHPIRDFSVDLAVILDRRS